MGAESGGGREGGESEDDNEEENEGVTLVDGMVPITVG